MMSNFAHLLATPAFEPFASVAVAAEKILPIDPSACVLNCRRAMEAAVKWMYSVDDSLDMHGDDRLVSLLSTEEFRGLVDEKLLFRLNFIRKMGNNAAHGDQEVTREQAVLCLQNLFVFLDFVAYCYGDGYEEHTFDATLLEERPAAASAVPPEAEVKLAQLTRENAALRDALTRRRANQQQTYVPKPLDISEYRTRKVYIDTMLQDAGWIEGKNWLNEVELRGASGKGEAGYADYALHSDDGKVLAVVEATRTCEDPAEGRQQARRCADIIEKRQGCRPVIFLTNGFETRIDDGQYPERRVAAIYSKRDLEKWFSLRRTRAPLTQVTVDQRIAGRYYQQEAVKAVCGSFDRGNRRKALLAMATGSGKTRTVIALCKVLLDRGWARNILFLADRASLVTQAKRSFARLLPKLSVTNLCEEGNHPGAQCVFSTYQAMMNRIDDLQDDEGKLFTVGHFDLVVCDEAHRSIYNRYRDIFTYFDAPLVGLTATPRDEIDRSTYEAFELEDGAPTYGYDLARAVKDGYLVDFLSVETTLKFTAQGIVYDDLSEADKRAYEDTFENEDGKLPASLGASALNEWLLRRDTIREMLHVLMSQGLRIDHGKRLGKTIIFAQNHAHAKKILQVFTKEYPRLSGFAQVIDSPMANAQRAIDAFSNPKKPPQIAISVDMLDTGIDVPQVLNLVFFKRVMSKAKFWQMIGRGTRLCPGLVDGADKQRFYVFDFCGNFEFFRMDKGKPAANLMALAGAIFLRKAQMAFQLQAPAHQTGALTAFRRALVDDMVGQVRALNRDNFAVRQHLKYVELYADPDNYRALTHEDTVMIGQELAPLIGPGQDDAEALRFDALLYGLELACLAGKRYGQGRSDLTRKVTALSDVTSVPEITAQEKLIDSILHTNYVETAGIAELEHVRESLRGLMKYLPVTKLAYDTHFGDPILSMD